MEREPLFEIGRRTFDTPEFRGIEFIEVEAKTIINHVPGNYLPFNWTINPYRGCSHSCSYCGWGEMPILMGDGGVKPLADTRVGDEVYGTRTGERYHYYVKTRVLNHWAVTKRAFRTTLEDGTELITSGDHRFLSNRGWKHVTGSESGPDQRPFLTVNNKLMGTGRFARGPEGGTDYRRGYLCGIIRGDGHVGSYSYSYGAVHGLRLALVDLEALRRARRYLSEIAISLEEVPFQEAVGARKAMYAIRSGRRAHMEAIKEMCAWPALPSLEWTKGFLAGIFDAEGSYSRGILRFSNTNDEIIGKVTSCLRRLGFAFR
ncbi:MAG TPA: LAGLIDADG family homing endonuclease, partial [Actinomycetota bacterium]|nr:LAGLIDADG family homing endonuclease [Actinomycetota bacterium]